MTNQPGIQTNIQNATGIHTQSQSNVPGAVNNGNPNTIYNWSSYQPQLLPPTQLGGAPNVKFNLATAQAPASSAGYIPPFTADPYAAMLMATMPKAMPNANVNNILSNMYKKPLFNIAPGAGGGVTPPVTPDPPPTGPQGGGSPPVPPTSSNNWGNPYGQLPDPTIGQWIWNNSGPDGTLPSLADLLNRLRLAEPVTPP